MCIYLVPDVAKKESQNINKNEKHLKSTDSKANQRTDIKIT